MEDLRHLTREELDAGLDTVRQAPSDEGVLRLIVRRPAIGEREVLEEGATGSSGGATPAMVAEALREFRPVSTSRPTPSALVEVYERAAAEGATEIVLVRHGASEAAVEGAKFPLVDGHSDPPLSDAGHSQARSPGLRWACAGSSSPALGGRTRMSTNFGL